jgi:quinol monooxygenase YgiN
MARLITMVHITIQYTVGDFDKWKSGFDEYSDARKTAGCLSTNVYVSPDDRNSLNIVFEWDSKENFMKYSSNPELQEAMKKSGLTSQPTMRFWDLQTD